MATVDLPVARGSKSTTTTRANGGQLVRWTFTVADGFDISFGAVFMPNGSGGSPVQIQLPLRVTSDAGAFRVPVDGVVEFTLDNSYSYLRGKTVLWRSWAGDAATVAAAGGAGGSGEGAVDTDTANAMVMKGVDLFFTNHFGEAEAWFEKESKRIPIFALSFGTMAFMRALMTWEPEAIAQANTRLRAAQELAATVLPKESMLGSLFRSTAAGSMTTAQLEATVIHAEATLLMALLHLTEESIMGMVRAGLAIRTGWQLYTKADKAMGGVVSAIKGGPPLQPPARLPRDADAEEAPASPIATPTPTPTPDTTAAPPATPGSPITHVNAEVLGGLQFGMGTFNTTASVLPDIVLRIIAVLGFPCDREAGMEQLRESLRHWNVRSPLAALFLLVMRVLLPSFHSGDVSAHVPEAEAVLAIALERYKDSALFLWMAGRLARMQGNVALARERLLRCADSQTEWIQLAHLCAYELGWCYAFLHDWDNVLPLFQRLKAENEWSKAFYAYMTGVALLQQGSVAAARVVMRDVLKHGNRRLGGKVISAEQYCIRRAAEFLALTYVDAGDAEAVGVPATTAEEAAEEAALLPAAAAGIPRLRVPAVVPRGSVSHAIVLAYAVPCAGLESMYLFNGASQMDETALHAGIAQVDAILAATASGVVFRASTPVWQGSAAAAEYARSPPAAVSRCQWVDAHRESGKGGVKVTSTGGGATFTPVAPKTVEEVTALLDAAAGAPVEEFTSISATPSVKSTPVATAGTPSLAPAPTGISGRFSLMSLVGMGGGAGGSGSPLPSGPGSQCSAYATPTPTAPVITAAVAALCRGSMCASLGRVDEAAACYRWIIDQGEEGALKRDLHVYAYALYEMGILYADGTKALSRRAHADSGGGGGGGGVGSSPASTSTTSRHSHIHGGDNILASALLTGLTGKQCREHVRLFMKRGKDIRDDFNWKVRLHLRIHLTIDDLRSKPGRRGITGDAAAWTSGADGGNPMDTAKLEAAMLTAAAGPIGGSPADDGDETDDMVDEDDA